MSNKTALLLFSRTALKEAAEKNFSGRANKKLNHKLSSGLINHTYNISVSSQISLHVVNEKDQKGTNFGEKIANAAEAIFKIGYEKLLIIGNDCPQLTTTYIQNASQALDNNNVVLGPDNHGGVYLIGLNKKVFNKENFETRQWQTPDLFKDLEVAYCQTSSFKLPQLNDVNNFEDLKLVKDFLSSSHKIKALILSILACLQRKYSKLRVIYCNLSFSLLPFRGPPVL